MIVEYHRPEKLEDALALLSRLNPVSLPIGGGTTLDRSSPEPIAVVDLQSLDLDTLSEHSNTIELGACVTLQALLSFIEEQRLESLMMLPKVLRHEASYNLRQVGTLAGTLMSADGRSPFTTAMIALDCTLTIAPGSEVVGLGEILPLRREFLPHRLITSLSIPKNVNLSYEFVARSPADLPIVCAAGAVWPSGRTRVALGGFGASPILVFDGNDGEGAELAAASAYSQAGDQWASAEYRQEIASVLTKRLVPALL